ncbi:MAG: CPBP family intramembrane metalloprotease [Alphaproteobacteria bacterium]|nr:CPBP family intramembrane metalloprotease [Alphaproteobacteria bacterium]
MTQIGTERQKARTGLALLGFAFALGCLNDFAFMALSGTNGVYLADYAFKLAILAVLLGFRKAWPAPPEKLGTVALLAFGWAALVAVGVLTDPWIEMLGRGWKLIDWPPIENRWFNAFDLSFGLALTALVEELAFRRIALTALPGGFWQRLILSSLLFGLIHWGQGYGHIAVASLVGLAFGYAYLRTGSLVLVVLAHYAVNLILFW